MAKFGFTDLHSFKDYVTFVQAFAPDDFPVREGISKGEQWTLELAFEGLRLGMSLAIEEKGERQVFTQCQKLVEEAYTHYRGGRKREGFHALEDVRKQLRKIPSQ